MGKRIINIQRDVVSRENIQNGLPQSIQEIEIEQVPKSDAQSEVVQESEDDQVTIQPEESKKKTGRTAKGNG